MQTPLVSIIIPTYNRAHLIGETLDSVLAQTYTHWECIVVDDGSTDNTAALLATYCKKDSRIQYHQRPATKPKGANACRNYGFELSKGEYINWFDDDDIMLPEFIELKVSVFNSDIEMVICSGYYTNALLEDKNEIPLQQTDHLFQDFVLWKAQVLTPSVLFKKSYLNNKALFSYAIERGQETEFFSRIFFKISSKKYLILSKLLFLYRLHSNTKTALDTNYVSEFKNSQAIITLSNLNRGFQIKNAKIVKYCYLGLVQLFVLGIKTKHFKNAQYILKNLVHSVIKNSFWQGIKLFVMGSFLLFIKRNSYRIEKEMRKLHIKIAATCNH